MSNTSDATWVLRVCCDPAAIPAVQVEVQRALAHLLALFPSSELSLYSPVRVLADPGVVPDSIPPEPIPLEPGEVQLFELMKQSINAVVSAWNRTYPPDPARKQATNGVYKFLRVIEVHQLRFIGDLLRLREETIESVANFGKSALSRLKSALQSLNLQLAPDLSAQLLRTFLQWRLLQPAGS